MQSLPVTAADNMDLAAAREQIARIARGITKGSRQRAVIRIMMKHGIYHLLKDRSRDDKTKYRLLGRRLRLAFEELGPTYIKLGQVILTRQEMVPPEVTDELTALLDNVPAMPFVFIRTVIADEGKEWAHLIKWIDPNPIGSASLAQVYKGQLWDGRMVAIKVVRPLVDKLFQTDISAIRKLVKKLQRLLPPEMAASSDLPGLINDYYSSAMDELNMEHEAGIMRQQQEFLREFETLHIPDVYFASKRVLIMEFVDGWNLKDFPVDFFTFEERMERMTDLAHYYIKSFVEGYYHADAHGSNIMIDKNTKKAVVLDWGMTGRMDAIHTEAIFRMLMHIRSNQAEDAAEVALDIYEPTKYTDPLQFKDQLRSMFIHYTDTHQGSRYNWGNLLFSTLNIAMKNYCRTPTGLALWAKGFSATEGTARWLCPEISYHDLVETADVQIVRRWLQRRMNYRVNASLLAELLKLGTTLPRKLTKILEHFEWNKFNVNIETRLSSTATRTIHRAATKLSLSNLAGRLFVGGAGLVAFAHTPYGSHSGMQALGSTAVAVSGVLGLWVLWSAYRTRKAVQ
ncbi:AarF/ABC1/UbiB kinase family protein [Alicyclobacillus tolerans]|uniref:ABC1 kinase family protein n=1 Tax=Alicyclobacillus tolerans TaxID=90970 RepID=UPI001F16D32D|nr:AarF/ABC1/UbiB kinase family protein [Alicyclobacillus tolerans]MCF8566945.1 AarF/ABC1/UbiB kinase family protein [Alicyclobacillus tolerans]